MLDNQTTPDNKIPLPADLDPDAMFLGYVDTDGREGVLYGVPRITYEITDEESGKVERFSITVSDLLRNATDRQPTALEAVVAECIKLDDSTTLTDYNGNLLMATYDLRSPIGDGIPLSEYADGYAGEGDTLQATGVPSIKNGRYTVLTVTTNEGEPVRLITLDDPSAQLDTAGNDYIKTYPLALVDNSTETETKIDRYVIASDIPSSHVVTFADVSEAIKLLAAVKVISQAQEETAAQKGKRKYARQPKNIVAPIDPVTNALFATPDKAIKPFLATEGNPLKITTGRGLYAEVHALADYDQDIFGTLAYKDKFWAEAYYTLLIRDSANCPDDGLVNISVSEILKLTGIANPYKGDGIEKIRAVSESLHKVSHTYIYIDTTGEARAYERNRGSVLRSVTEQRLIDAAVSTVERQNGTYDLVLTSRPYRRGAANNPCPLLDYAQEKGQIILLRPELFEFRIRGRMTLQNRMMMKYVYEHFNYNHRPKSLKLQTIYDALEIHDRRARDSAKKRLIECLDDWRTREPAVVEDGYKIDDALTGVVFTEFGRANNSPHNTLPAKAKARPKIRTKKGADKG